MFGTGKKSTVANRANYRPKAQLGETMKEKILTKILKFAHSKLGKFLQGLATKAGVLLAGNGILSDSTTELVVGALVAASGEVLDWVVFQISTHYIKDAQTVNGTEPDAYAGPVTRIVTEVPKLNSDGTPILHAKP